MGKKSKNKRRRQQQQQQGNGAQQVKRSMLPTFIYIVALFALITPLLPSSAPSIPVTMTQAAIFQAAVVLMLALWLPLALTDRRYWPRKSLVTLAVVLFGLMMLVSLPFSVDPDLSFWSQLWRMTGVWNLLHYVVWFLVLSSVIHDRKDWRTFFAVSCICALIAGLYGAKQWLTDPMSASVLSTLGNQSLLAAYVLPHIFIAAYLYIGSRIWAKYFYGLIMLVGIFTIVISASRGAALALVASLAVMLASLAYFSSWSRQRRLAATALALALPFLAIGAMFVLRTAPIKDVVTSNAHLPRFVQRVIYRDIGADRKLLWSYAWRGYMERPIFGWGNEMYGYLYDYYFDYNSSDKEIFNERWQDRAHNQYLDILVSYGTIGMLSFVAIWVTAALALLAALKKTDDREEKKRVAMLATVFVSYLVFVLTIFDTPAQLTVVFAVLALVAGLKQSDNSADEPVASRAGLRIILLTICLVSSLVAIWINIAPVFRAAKAHEALIQLRSDRRDLKANFSPAFKLPNAYVHGMRYAAIFETQKYMELAQLHGAEMEDGIRYLAEQAEMSADERPFSSRYLIGAATATRMLAVYDETALERSEKYAQQIIDLVPNRFDGYVEMAEAAIMRGEFARAIELLEQAEERVYTNRSDLKSHIYMLMATAYAGQRNFPAMFERLKLAEENDSNAFFDARLVLMLSRVVQPGDSISEISAHLDQVFSRYNQVPIISDAVNTIRNVMNTNVIDVGSAAAEMTN